MTHSMVLERKKIKIEGRVQGVGFRPFVYHLAQKYLLSGFVYNLGSSVLIEVQGDSRDLALFDRELKSSPPENSRIEKMESELIPLAGDEGFRIVSSQESSESLYLPNDLAICGECLKELRDPGDPRFAYPFTHCATCGPRWSLLESLPYDRKNTTMRDFPMCERCNQEYFSVENRRFHAQTMSCPKCGPRVELCDENGQRLSQGSDGIKQAAELLLRGRIVAVKGVGGFQLWCRADLAAVVQELRIRKRRPKKAFALMVPDIKVAKGLCEMADLEERCLLSVEAPIVLLERKANADMMICPEVAPGLSELGIMLPCTPLHHLLMDHIQMPVVATSANLTDEPIAYDTDEVFIRLRGIADFVLTDNRRIVRAVDDSVVRFVAGRMQMLRLARGFAPAVFHPVGLEGGVGQGYGSDLKSTLCIQKNKSLVLSQHLGDLSSESSIINFKNAQQDFSRILGIERPFETIRDFHPDLISSRLAPATSKTVQHHAAHFFSAFIEHRIRPPALGVIWDGTGLGLNQQIWGGEFLFLDADNSILRIASLRPFSLIGGDFAIKDTRRIAFDLLREANSQEKLSHFQFSLEEASVWSALSGAPKTTSMGRLFDGVWALLMLEKKNYQPPTYEGEHAIALEELAKAWRKSCSSDDLLKSDREVYPCDLNEGVGGFIEIDWRPMLNRLIFDISNKINYGAIADKFQRSVISMALDVIKKKNSVTEIVLAGGCFQNRFLLDKMSQELKQIGKCVYWPEKIPLHDGGISAGQLYSNCLRKI